MRNILSFIILALCFSSPALAKNYSGFLDNYPPMKADKDRAGAMVYNAPNSSLRDYNKIMIDPVYVFYHRDATYKGISPDDLKVLTDGMRQILTENMEPDYPTVSQPGKGVLRVRLAITDVKVKKKKRGFFSYTPIGLVVTGAKSLAGADPGIDLMGATIEAELLDATTGKRLGVLIDPLINSKDKKGKMTWGRVEEVLTFYAKRFHKRLDGEHGIQ